MNSDYKLIYRKEATKYLAKQEASVQERIAKGLAGLITIPRAATLSK